MKSKILTLIIGILIGAIITTIGFLIYNKTVVQNSNQPEMMQMDENGQMGKPDGDNGETPERPDGDNGDAPEKPDGDNGETSEKPDGNNGEEPPTKPDESNNNTNS